MEQDSQMGLSFANLKGKTVQAHFDGGTVTSDAGALLLREIDRRMRFLLKRLRIAEVVDQSQQKNRDQVFFGAIVTYTNEVGDEKTIRIVGVDEARLEFSEVSWVSPIARALLTAWEGDVVKVRTPNGLEEIEVVEISYT